jgi:hypothetical protein
MPPLETGTRDEHRTVQSLGVSGGDLVLGAGSKSKNSGIHLIGIGSPKRFDPQTLDSPQAHEQETTNALE